MSFAVHVDSLASLAASKPLHVNCWPPRIRRQAAKGTIAAVERCAPSRGSQRGTRRSMAPSAMTQLMAAIVFATVKFQSDADTIACAAIATPKADNVQAIVSSEERAAQFGMTPASAASTPRGARVPQGATISAQAAPNATASTIAAGPVKASAARMMRVDEESRGGGDDDSGQPRFDSPWTRRRARDPAHDRDHREDGREDREMQEQRCAPRPLTTGRADGPTLSVSTACVSVTTIASGGAGAEIR